jgi:hypothetical protein
MGSDVHLTFERLDLDPINVLPTDRNMVSQNQISMFLIIFSRYVIRNDVFMYFDPFSTLLHKKFRFLLHIETKND